VEARGDVLTRTMCRSERVRLRASELDPTASAV
jgi:hypothetical protein